MPLVCGDLTLVLVCSISSMVDSCTKCNGCIEADIDVLAKFGEEGFD